MKHKVLIITVITIICITASAVSVICFVSNENNMEKQIEFTAVYDKNEKIINVRITNNTENMTVGYSKYHNIYRNENGIWKDVTPKYNKLFTPESYLFYYDDNKTGDIVFYPYDEGEPDTILPNGDYKLETRVYLYDKSLINTLPSESDKFTIDAYADYKAKDFTVEAEFTIE